MIRSIIIKKKMSHNYNINTIIPRSFSGDKSVKARLFCSTSVFIVVIFIYQINNNKEFKRIKYFLI